jgi:hypothetical protein
MKKTSLIIFIFSLSLKVFTQPINYDDEKSLINPDYAIGNKC